MRPPVTPAAIAQPTPGSLNLSGDWTARGIGKQLESSGAAAGPAATADGAGVSAMDSAGAWVLHKLLSRLRDAGTPVTLLALRPEFARLHEAVVQQVAAQAALPAPPAVGRPSALARVGQRAAEAGEQALAMLSFVGETALALAASLAHPARIR